jgi:hypothetical protein
MGSAGAGASSTARARLAGVMFSMVATVGCSRSAATHRRVTFYVSPNLIEWFWNQILRYTFFLGTNAHLLLDVCRRDNCAEKRDVR